MATKSVKYELDALSKKAERSVQNLTDEINKSVNALQRQDKSTKASGRTFSVFIGNLAANATGALVRSLFDLGRQIVELGGETIQSASKLEDLEVQFRTLTGSASQARDIMEGLTEFAAQTPFQLEGLAKVSTQLLSFGFEVDDIQSKLQRIGDVAAASGSQLSEVGLIFGQISAAGKLTGERLLQLQERGIPILAALADQMGTTQGAVRSMVTEGKIDFETFEQAFNSLSNEGGFAFEGMITQSRTLSGLISTLSDNWTLRLAEIGKAFLPLAKALATMAIDTLKTFDTQIIVDWIKNGILVAIDALRSFADSLNPIVSNMKTLWNIGQLVIKGFIGGFQGIIVQAAKLGNWIDNLIADLVQKIPKRFLPQSWIDSIEENRRKSNEFLNEAKKQFKSTRDSINRDIKDIGDAWSNNAFSDETIENIKSRLNTIKDAVITTRTEIDEDQAERREKEKVIMEETFALEQEQAQNRLEYIREILGQEQALKTEQQIQELINKDKFNKAKEKLDSEFRKAQMQDIHNFQRFDEMSQRQRFATRKKVLSNIASLQNAHSKELAAIGKSAALVQIAIDTEEAVAGAYAWGSSLGGPVLGGIFAGLAAAAQAQRAANVVGIQGFEQGGIVAGNSFTGDNLLARVNSGEMILNREQQNNLFELARGGIAGQGQEIIVHTSVELDGEQVGHSVSRQVANGLELGEVV